MNPRAGEGESLKPPVQQKQKRPENSQHLARQTAGGSTPGQFAEEPKRSFISNEVSALCRKLQNRNTKVHSSFKLKTESM
jgi:hypothetical protein